MILFFPDVYLLAFNFYYTSSSWLTHRKNNWLAFISTLWKCILFGLMTRRNFLFFLFNNSNHRLAVMKMRQNA